MTVDVLLGLQWGDEGKGKIVDVLSGQYDLVARFQGGPNAGHTLEFEGKRFVLKTLPSGVFLENTMNLIGNGVVIDPISLRKELEHLDRAGYNLIQKANLTIARKAHLILPTHRALDIASEKMLGAQKIGSTLNGITPAYLDKTGRLGLRIGDINTPDFKERYQQLRDHHMICLKAHYDKICDIHENEKDFFDAIEFLQQFPFVDAEHMINGYLNRGQKVLAEGAQGTMLDLDFGSYPFVTSSNTIAAGVCTGLGIAPQKINEVIGVFKAYSTRVGSGPFPTELNDVQGAELRSLGAEFGANTLRPRRTGWLDLPALKYAVMINGVTKLVMTKADVLSGFEEIGVCTHYKYKGELTDKLPYDIDEVNCIPVYQYFKGWKNDLSNATRPTDIPSELLRYIEFLEEQLEIPIKYLSVGPNRLQTINLTQQ